MELLNLSTDQNWNAQLSINILIPLIILIIIFLSLIYIKCVHRAYPAKIEKVIVNIPFGIGSFELAPDLTAQRAAWSLYVELVTRISVQHLKQEEGLAREALSSLYSLFSTTRQILKDAGPEIGISEDSVGGIAIAVLNRGLRPFLAKWHPRLQVWEAKHIEGVWPEEEELRGEIENLRGELKLYAEALEIIANPSSIRRLRK